MKIPILWTLYLFAIISPPVLASWKDIRFRAREHFEVQEFKMGSVRETYKGATNTLNVWYERPFNFSVGLAAGPILGASRANDSDFQPQMGDKVILRWQGLEGKYFPWGESLKVFVRGGVYAHQLTTNGDLGRLTGWGSLAGVGIEIPIGVVSIAPEFSVRQISLSDNVSAFILSPAIGFHFYPELRK